MRARPSRASEWPDHVSQRLVQHAGLGRGAHRQHARLGGALRDERIAKGDRWEVDTSGVLAWWRCESTPGANDGRFTDWQRVNTIQVDEMIEL
jgi:hypothetical protein